MKVVFVFLVAIMILSCQKSTLSDPNFIEGDYITNGLLDISCVAVEQGKLPMLTVSKVGQGTYDMVITRYLPVKSSTAFLGVKLIQEDGLDKLSYQNKNAGSWKKIEGFGDQKILTISIQSEPTQINYFAGVKK
jgi:hypothetical protein